MTGACILVYSCASVAQASSRSDRQVRTERAVSDGMKFLLAQIGPSGMCKTEFPAGNPRFGGMTALCAHALLTAGIDPKDATLKRAMKWLTEAKLTGVYAVAMRVAAMSAFPDKRLLGLIRKDARWLIEAASSSGAYTYTSLRGRSSTTYDNSNGQMAVMGLWAASARGVKVPAQYWKRIERYWLSEQNEDGGWGYRKRKGAARNKTYGSMTAAGLATLYVCFDNLRQKDFVRCESAKEYPPIVKALTWLAKNYDIADNPRLGVNWYYYWLYSLQRVGLASGRRYFGRHDWYAEGLAELLRRQNPDGSWGYGSAGDRLTQTAFALSFLVRGRNPILLSKLQYTGKWNPRPRDCANFTRWISYDLERPVNWQVVDADAPLADLHDSPILYISGAGPVSLTDKQIDRLRAFVQQGGMILSEAACNSGDFTLDMIRIYKKLFPNYKLERLGDDHPIYTIQPIPKDLTGLAGVHNGVRLLAIHSPRELSLAMQLGPRADQMPWFRLLSNICMVATEQGRLRPRGTSAFPPDRKVNPIATIRVARLKYGGNFDPEPLAWRRLAILMSNRHRIRLEVSDPMEIASLDTTKWPIAAMTGTDAFSLSQKESGSLKKYLSSGGTLVIDAAGGSRAFGESVRKQIFPLVKEGLRGPVAQHVIFSGPEPMKKVVYRPSYAIVLGRGRNKPRLEGVLDGKRLAIIFSPDDITGGLVGGPCYRLRGYSAKTAVAIMTNLLCHVAGIKPPGASRSAPR